MPSTAARAKGNATRGVATRSRSQPISGCDSIMPTHNADSAVPASPRDKPRSTSIGTPWVMIPDITNTASTWLPSTSQKLALRQAWGAVDPLSAVSATAVPAATPAPGAGSRNSQASSGSARPSSSTP